VHNIQHNIKLPSGGPMQDMVTTRLSALRRAMDRIPEQDIAVLIPHAGNPFLTSFGLGTWQDQQAFSWYLFHSILIEGMMAPQSVAGVAGGMGQRQPAPAFEGH
jgi:hypothetical protein